MTTDEDVYTSGAKYFAEVTFLTQEEWKKVIKADSDAKTGAAVDQTKIDLAKTKVRILGKRSSNNIVYLSNYRFFAGVTVMF